MRTGKLAQAPLKRSVLRQLNTQADQPDRAAEKRYGADCAFLPQETGLASAYTAVSAVPGFQEYPEALVVAAANNLFAAKAVPQALIVHAVIPAEYEETALKEDMRRMADSAKEQGMQIIGGHTEVSREVNRPWYHLTGIGRTEVPADENTLVPEQALVVTKQIALAGTAALARSFEEELSRRFPVSLIDRAKEFEKLMSVAADARAATHFGSCAMHDLSQGGIFTALWEMAERAGVGLEVDLKKIPVRQETVELCEYFDINPYNLYSAGALLIGTDKPEALIDALAKEGVAASVIGCVTNENSRVIRNGEEMRFLDRPQQEEWYRRFEK